MLRVLLGSFAMAAATTAPVMAQEELPLGDRPAEEIITPPPAAAALLNLAALGLGGMRVVSDAEVLAGRCPPVSPAPIFYGPPVIGQRQLFMLEHADPDPLPRKAWRWAHRTHGF